MNDNHTDRGLEGIADLIENNAERIFIQEVE